LATTEDDDWGDVDVARQLAEQVRGAEVFLYAGDRHLFTETSPATSTSAPRRWSSSGRWTCLPGSTPGADPGRAPYRRTADASGLPE
jgi:hypothetical protein